MQVWCDSRDIDSPSKLNAVFDMILTQNPEDMFYQNQNKLYLNNEVIGFCQKITDGESQNKARTKIGIVEWLLIEFADWKMIPIENLIAECDGTITKIAVSIDNKTEIHGAAFALQTGVDAILIPNGEEIIEQAMIAKSQRLEKNKTNLIQNTTDYSKLKLEPSTISKMAHGGIGDRYCIDLTSTIEKGEGMLIGSSAASLALIHGETIESEFVPPRPFRVNAGPPHSYVMMFDGTTKYLSELKSGDEIMLVSSHGQTRSANIGRLKIEKRPFLTIFWVNNYFKPCTIFLQQAETVRVVCQNGDLKSVTNLKSGDQILCYNSQEARHIGQKVSAQSKEI